MSTGAFEVVEVAPRPIAVGRAETTWPELSATIQRADNGHIPTAVGWEHYGHWQEDPEQLQTMIAVVLQP